MIVRSLAACRLTGTLVMFLLAWATETGWKRGLTPFLLLAGAATASAELADPLPNVPVGTLNARYGVFASGLPVEQEFVTPVFTQRVGPTDLAVVPGSNGATVITTYGGTAYYVTGSATRLTTPLLDLRSPESPTYSPNFEVGGAHGLTTIAFHPDFADPDAAGFAKFYTLEPERLGSGKADFFESIVRDDHHQDVLYEYRLPSPDDTFCDITCANSKRELLRVTQPGWHHNLGDLLFDDDGLLLISSGDGNVARSVPPHISDNAQILSNVFGAVLRIDPLGNNSRNGNYGIPASNPFADPADGRLDEIFAFGLRNPYRLEFDSATGELYASETGELSIESVERIERGGNFGWNAKEGTFLYDKTTRKVALDEDGNNDGLGDFAEKNRLIDPVLQYDHGDGRAIVGAVPFRGSSQSTLAGKIIVADFDGAVFYGDPGTGELRRFATDPAGHPPADALHSVNRDAAGEVYLLGIERSGPADDDWNGVVLKLQATPSVPGDFNIDGQLDATDIDLLSAAIRDRSIDRLFDVSEDGELDQRDRRQWIYELKQSLIGDSTLDGHFDSADLILVFQSGEYEDDIALNSGWSDGDWNGDGEFTTRDLVFAFQNTNTPQPEAPTARHRPTKPMRGSDVPEPADGIYWLATVAAWILRRRQR